MLTASQDSNVNVYHFDFDKDREKNESKLLYDNVQPNLVKVLDAHSESATSA